MDEMRRLFGLLWLSLVLATCGMPPATSTGTGIQGIVEAGPTCPVERIDSPCPPHPMAATLVVHDAGGAEVTRVQSGADGRFKVDLPPATYTLVGLASGPSRFPRPIPTTVTVTAGSYTAVTVQYDTGIR
jgi:hypothetical protein